MVVPRNLEKVEEAALVDYRFTVIFVNMGRI